MSRLGGGIGTRGPGETRLEMDRRRIRRRMSDLRREIDELSGQRSLRRARREKNKVPVVALVGIYFGRREGGQSSSLLATVPWFLLVFAALVIVISLHWVPPPLVTAMQDTARWCLVVAIAGLGVKTSIQQLAQVGWRPIAVLLANTVFLAVFAGALLARA